MTLPSTTYNKGFVRTVVLIVIALIALGYFGFNLRSIINSPTVQDNLIYSKEIVVYVWTTYLKVPVLYIWNMMIGFFGGLGDMDLTGSSVDNF